MKRRFFITVAALVAGLATPGVGLAQDGENTTSANLSGDDKHDVLCILTTGPREERGLERIAYFFGRFSARHPNSRFTPTLTSGMPYFRELDGREQNALSRVCQEEFRLAFG